MILLDFEEPIGKLQEQLDKAVEIGEQSGVDVSQTINDLENKINKTRKEIYSNLTSFEINQYCHSKDLSPKTSPTLEISSSFNLSLISFETL